MAYLVFRSVDAPELSDGSLAIGEVVEVENGEHAVRVLDQGMDDADEAYDTLYDLVEYVDLDENGLVEGDRISLTSAGDRWLNKNRLTSYPTHDTLQWYVPEQVVHSNEEVECTPVE